jgi:UDP-hydrolysing UDP-N-acetyl-D-glucosamine 2-epimerase
MTESSATRRIAVLTTGRQDWGILRSTCDAISAHPDLDLVLLAGGMHLSERHGPSVDDIRTAGFTPDLEIRWLDAGGDPTADVQAARALESIAVALRSTSVDALVIAGDRLETIAAALAATFERVPIVHLHGGEQTTGAFDDALRHAITKLSHLHLVSHQAYRRRVVALGEDPATVFVVGSPGLDAAHRTDLADRAELETALGIRLETPVVLVTIQPATLDLDPAAVAIPIGLAMSRVPATYVITSPNSDPGAGPIRTVERALAREVPRTVVVDALGERRYWGLLRVADAMLGNSSSGIIEAPAVDLPAVNVGDRQAGRLRETNVIDVEATDVAVEAGLRRALDERFRASVKASHPTLGDGRAGMRIADIIAAWRPTTPPRKAPIQVDP